MKTLLDRLDALKARMGTIVFSDEYLEYRQKLKGMTERRRNSSANMKLKLLELAEHDELRPMATENIGMRLCAFTGNHKDYDPEFDLWIRTLQPSWFDQPGSGQFHYNYNFTVYEWIHKDGRTFRGTRHELITEFKLPKGNMYKLFKGEIKSCKGWTFAEVASGANFKWSPIADTNKYDKLMISYKWSNLDGRTFTGTVMELCQSDPTVSQDNAKRVAGQYKGYRSAGGWFITNSYVEGRGGRNRLLPTVAMKRALAIVKSKNGEIVRGKYEGMYSRIEVRCVSGHVWSISFGKLFQNRWCKICMNRRTRRKI